MVDHDPHMLRGVLSVLLLKLTADQEDYGYSLVLRLHQHGLNDLAEDTVYPALTRLQTQGLLAARREPSQKGPPRKYYQPTAAGYRELARTSRLWHSLVDSVSNVLTPPNETAVAGVTERILP